MANSFNSMNKHVLSNFRKVPRGNKPMSKKELNIPGAIEMKMIVR